MGIVKRPFSLPLTPSYCPHIAIEMQCIVSFWELYLEFGVIHLKRVQERRQFVNVFIGYPTFKKFSLHTVDLQRYVIVRCDDRKFPFTFFVVLMTFSIYLKDFKLYN